MHFYDLTHLSEMANLPPARTGVNYIMWLGKVGGQHGPRIKVSNTKGRFDDASNFSITVSKQPKIATPPGSVGIPQHDLANIFRWIQLNYNDLMLLWQIYETGNFIQLANTVLDDATILSRLKKI